ncbi:uncharacterized protein SPSK_10162 [Sporothrix schenckii 1099-18]|uniref:Uncharacterized protein n=1 Tax=Sporothrix schenckii 1099-18 TaxID=1397361 RepID=A0A0F2M7J1_SPOSC|nr:uncharacterized protein SPSK_10162 [Sporothrix schenckii 1099-18]KJR84795.1 hypothetical protein SPSK_10162 [Sporothrix schenckii 1099-18]
MSLPLLEFGDDGYSLSIGELNNVPDEFLDLRIRHVYVEFLNTTITGMTTEQIQNAKNHAILKIDFETGYTSNRISYLGTRLSMEPN